MSTGAATGNLIRVLIADDHPVVRGGLRAALDADPGIQVVGEASDGLEAEDIALQVNPDLIIMDIYMPVREGVKSMVSIRQKLPDVKIVFLTVSDREADLLAAIRLGADGYILKRSDVGDIVSAVRRVMAGESILSPLLTARVLKELKDRQAPALTPREHEVLDLVSEGLTNAEIARRLSISPGSASTYVFRLLKKLHFKNRAEAIRYTLGPSPADQPM
ncbi:MAG: hypothetical protein A2147_11390 [Chloroflexi bacterium RBG_16_57_8]|nr:MAG: hypothetical protein A2147_11390 [Chloroflexi bacterium RBG_16_57_8]